MVNLKSLQLHEANCIWKEEESLELKIVDNWQPSGLQQTYAKFAYYKHQAKTCLVVKTYINHHILAITTLYLYD